MTRLGGTHASFDETDWAVVHALADSNAEFAEAAQARLLRDYWAPIFAFIRRSGRQREQAMDLTQEFIATVVLTRGLFRSADRSRGRFRSLIKAAIGNFMVEQHRRSSARKRHPASPLRSLSPGLGLEEPADARTPEAAFDYQLATTAIHRALMQAKQACLRDGLAVHARLLEEKVIRPILAGTPAPGFEELARRHGQRDARQASNYTTVARRHFREHLRREVGRWVASEDEIDAELARLIGTVSAAGKHGGEGHG